MSTKINVRSPYFLEFQEPTPSLGTYDCDVANLRNFSISSSGLITEPTPQIGYIIDRSHTEFPENTTGSDIPRTVTYTLQIPVGYSNYDDSTYQCDLDFDQPSQTAQEDPDQNDNCPTFGATDPPDDDGIPDVTNSTSTTINLSTYFTAGSGATISNYVVKQTGSTLITYDITGSTMTISSPYNCLNADFVVVARNSNDACTANSNTFNFSTPCTEDADCDDVQFLGGKVYQNGDHSLSAFKAGWRLKELLYNGNVITSPYNVGANTSGSPVTKNITYRMYIPQGYNNYSVGATLDCDRPFTQPSSDDPNEFDCAEAAISGIVISKKGTVAAPTSYNGTLVSWAPQGFFPVQNDTPRTITVTITPPSTNYSNSGGDDITCDIPVTQPGTGEECGETAFYITYAQAADPAGLCGLNHTTYTKLYSTAVAFDFMAVGDKICREDGGDFTGGSIVYGYAATSGVAVGGAYGYWKYIRIDDSGIVQEIDTYNCADGSTSGGDGDILS